MEDYEIVKADFNEIAELGDDRKVNCRSRFSDWG